ncbi:hypothetical protein [Deinococcus yavapaiensis]|uniref:Uncharacterized protein n=1 Tax=Deinococcus yavapaiensis KR-236 TaxID=694435 RepID=A0A318S3H0_9DEIO|nr:hypothetical protein DES52_11664 [Deinococcus yavapaiensis KR-236]
MQRRPEPGRLLDVMVDRPRKTAAPGITARGGLDTLVLMEGIGENDAWMRDELLRSRALLGFPLDRRAASSAPFNSRPSERTPSGTKAYAPWQR